MTTADRYRLFGQREARPESPTYERLALAIAEDLELLRLIDTLPEPRRQPNLLFAATRYLAGPMKEPEAFRDWALRHWSDLARIMSRRRTQTNEPARCSALLPVLAGLPQPLALLEVGASAGLCLYPDAYRYHYGRHTVGPADSPVQLDCAVEGDVPLPDRVPVVVWRAGLDLNPLDVSDDDDVRWLNALVWAEQHDRRRRLQAAITLARADPPLLTRGDLLTDLAALAARAPADATLVIFHSAVLAYVPMEIRTAFVELVQSLPARWISNEGVGVLPELTAGIATPPAGPAMFLLALDRRPLAFTAPHGQALRWLEPQDRHP
ncbi:DUF2332 domain-containing protein [Protofrankia symbiont of Coriaria ruscifolia]|uniref:DUF2332 domain-containing protein n=1 Tax=Candidatus Protofrankia californiensis TaxID=1839754 RepID=A0A1C3P0M4_9ACTN|nr:DUF2332 domain-containing protein [Protofrankia symbiont of Coriaria ruscifolia]SBW23397.1 hypothetical protein FDG2_3762 [Candidatus Protofrankia californiensis]